MKTGVLYCAIALCLIVGSGCASRRQVCCNYDYCPTQCYYPCNPSPCCTGNFIPGGGGGNFIPGGGGGNFIPGGGGGNFIPGGGDGNFIPGY